MAEWLILLIVVPAIVVPVVMLVGFSGCDVVWSVDEVKKTPPAIESATGKNPSIITLTWKYGYQVQTFQFERTNLPEETKELFYAPSSPHDDVGRSPGTTYSYRVRAILTDGEEGDWSEPARGTTPSFEPTFEASLINDEPEWQGYCLVQRLEAVRLSRSGTQIRLTIRASSIGDASIDRIYISQPDAAGDPYDSAGDLKEVHSYVMVPANTAVTLVPDVDFVLDESKPLLVAVDFSPVPLSAISYTDTVPQEAVGYWRLGAEAAVRDRSAGYQPENRIYLIEKIEVG
jgi:hypothetical protein